MKKYIGMICLILLLTAVLCACGGKTEKNAPVGENGKAGSISGEVTVLAAASLTDVCGELQKAFNEKYPDVKLVFSFGSSGALMSQIEEGAPADVFFSAAEKQMTKLDEAGLMVSESITKLLENKIVLVLPADSDKNITDFKDIAGSEVTMIGLGEPESVPAGQYAAEIFENLGIIDEVKKKANYGSDVRTVLSWVESGEVDCGVVYATDAYTTDKVKIAAVAPEGSCKKIIYPAGIVKASDANKGAEAFLDFLKTDEAMSLFEKYGFAKAE